MGFSPDLMWIKNRDSTYDHALYDIIRGNTAMLSSSETDGSDPSYGDVESQTTGFEIDSNYSRINESSDNYVGWLWDAGGAASSNSDGTNTSALVSVSTTAGFSIVKYTGTGASATVGHGLTKTPKFIIIKDLDGTNYWNVYHKDVGYSEYLRLDDKIGRAHV